MGSYIVSICGRMKCTYEYDQDPRYGWAADNCPMGRTHTIKLTLTGGVPSDVSLETVKDSVSDLMPKGDVL